MESATKVFVVLFGYITLFYGVRGFHNDPKCGQNHYRHPKIIGGEDVKEAEFPWYVSIKETGQHICGGFIIGQNLAISASHCFRDFSRRAAESPKTISVSLAAHLDRRKSDKFSQKVTKNIWEQDVKVKRIIRHPSYDPFNDSGMFDIALLILESEINWNLGTRPVCLPSPRGDERKNGSAASHPAFYSSYDLISGVVDRDFKKGEVATVAGWSSKEGLEEESGTLQKVRLTLYGNEECKRILKEKNVTMKTDLDQSVICAGSIGFDSCNGDSGSALLVQRNKIWVAIGIVSSGYGKCGSGRPGLYTRISSYLDFIDKYRKEMSSTSPPSSFHYHKPLSFIPPQN